MAKNVVDDGNPWTPLKDLAAIVEAAVVRCQPGILNELEAALKKHKPSMIGLLKNSPRNSADAALVRKATTEGINLPVTSSESEVATKQKLPASIVEEALIISEMFELNEISSLQLLLQAEEQMCQYPGLTRGLVAVLLYYDGRKSLIQALRTLIQGRSGVTWTLGASEDITDLITKYTQSLLDDGLVDKILVQLKTNDWSKESMLLQKNLALGDAKHRRQVFDLFGEIRQGLADCIFAFAAQSGLPKTDVIRIIDHLSRVKAGDSNAIGTIDDVNMTLTMGLLYSIDAGAINKCPDGEDSLQSLPLLSDPAFLVQVHRELSHSNRRWEHTAIQSLAQFAWSMTLATVRSLMTSANLEQGQQAVVDDDELVLDAALDNGVFHWLCQSFLDSPLLKTEEFYRRRLHQLLTDLIVLMPLKVKELRNRADEAARNKLMHEQEGVQYSVPLAGQHFENLLAGLTKLYANDDLGLGLVLDFWCPSENIERLPQRQVSLYKFVRLAGDLLMPSLYTPYVDLLVSLSGHPQAALHCFNLLKLNGGQGGCSTVAWDHFFASLHQYFANLRQESHQMPASAMDSIYRRQMTRGISPTEVQGLASVLKLITVVCNHSEAARIAVAEHTNWQPTLVMVGLLSCAVPTVLKAEILNTLTALGKTSEVAFSIWQSIEAAQLITTVPTTSQQRPQGLWTELEDIEARNEEYPLTRSWLRLIDGLTEHGLPHGLGQGTRVPGFAPYFTFIREQIFFRFSTRAYKRPLEKWEIGSLVLKLMVKLLKDYEPTASDFAHKQHTASFQIMVQLLQSSEILRLLLFILDEAVNLLDTYQDFAGKLELEECSLYILRLLATGLKLQDSMLEAARQANTSLILTSLSKLLLAINPRSGKPDHLLNVVKFVTYAWRLPNHGLHAIEVIRGVANQSAMAQTAILATFRTSEAIANDIIKGFTDVLDNDEDEHEDGEEDVVDDIRLAAVDLLLDSLNLPGPTLTHFLLGFNLQKGISKSTIQPPGVLGAVRSPFHAILSLLRPTASGETSPSFERTPNLVVASMKLIYSLCSNLATSEVTLRFLRSSEDFLCTQVSLLPFGGCSEANKTQVNRATAWLLKAVAIEVKMLCQTRQRSQVARLSSLFLDATEAEQNVNYANYLTQLSRSSVLTTASHQPRNQGGQSQQHRLLTILESIDFAEEAMKPPSYEVFDPSQVDQVLKQCHVAAASTTHGGQHRMVDIKSLHKVLNTELASLQNSTANGLGSQRSLIQEEIKLILSYAVQWNGLQERSTSRRNLLDSWRQVAEMLLCTMPEVLVTSVASKQHLLLELLQMLLNKVSADNAMLEMTNQVSGVVLVLMASLRQTYGKTKKTSEDGGGGRQDAYVTILDDTTRIISSASSRLYSAALQAILKGLVMWIVGTSAAAQRVRANLYGALLSYLRIGKANKTSAEKNKANSDEERLKKANLEVLLGYGDSFLDIVCRDSVSGHEIRRMLALSLLDELVRLEGRGAWLYYLSKQGYLRHIIESLVIEDSQLANLVSSRPDHLKAFYTYETKMALLTRLASTATGSEMLLESGLMVKLSEMSVFSSRPETSNAEAMMESNDTEVIPSALSRYQQIVFPALKLCEAIMASLGSENRSAASQVLHFVTAHECLVRVGLHYSNLFTISGLQELSLLTGVIARSVTFEAVNGDVDSTYELSSHLSRIQRQMLALTSHFGQNECLVRKMEASGLFSKEVKGKAVQLVLEINANCMMYAATMVGKGKQTRVILAPNLSEAFEAVDHGTHGRSMSLGNAVLMIQNLVAHLLATRAALRDLKDKLATVHHLSSAELSAFLPEDQGPNSRLAPVDQRSVAAERIRTSIHEKDHDMLLATSGVENTIFVIWKHLDHFFHSVSARQHIEIDPPFMKSSGKPEQSWMSSESIERLKKDTRICFNDNLFRKLDTIETSLEEDKKATFFAGLNRRLKRIATLYT